MEKLKEIFAKFKIQIMAALGALFLLFLVNRKKKPARRSFKRKSTARGGYRRKSTARGGYRRKSYSRKSYTRKPYYRPMTYNHQMINGSTSQAYGPSLPPNYNG